MESRFTFLEDDCPKLAKYGRRAEHSTSDPNICLLCLGRIAEIITEDLCRRSNIPDIPEKLAFLKEKGVISEDIYRKISALTETKNDAADDGYDSEMACQRLMVTAEELCRWFMLEKAEGRFRFLADLFPPDKPVPILMNLSELGREAEENLFTNTRYCLICLGDMGEAVADRLISGNGIETHERDQVDRIDILSDRYIITDEIKNILHSLRMARNKALHERYNDEYISESEGRRLIADSLALCEWLFRVIMKSGYVVKARITGEYEGGYSAAIGRIPAYVPDDEVPHGKSCETGKKYVFKVADTEPERVKLSLSMADNDYSLSMARLYAKYRPGQNVHVTIKSLSNSTGAIVELKDGLEARIPPSELGRKIYRYDEGGKMIRYETTAKVKWFSVTQYPPMLLSVRDVEEEQREQDREIQTVQVKKPAMSDFDFRLLCKSAPYEKIIQALDEGANPNASNSNNTTALMMAAQYNTNARTVKALIEAGAEVDAKNRRGNTALMYSAMSNTPDVVRAIYNAGADIETVNNDGKKAADYAVTNRKLNGTDIVRLLRGENEEAANIETVETQEEFSQPETETLTPSSEPSQTIEETQSSELLQENESLSEEPVQSESESLPENEAPSAESEPSQENESPSEEPAQSEQESLHEKEATNPEPVTEPVKPQAPSVPPASVTSKPKEDTEEETTYYDYDIESLDEIPSEEDEETMREMRRELQRGFLKICRSGTEDEIAEAVSAGVNVNVTNKSYATALMFAAQSNTAEAVEILIHAGAILDAQDDRGNTALIYAAAYNNDDVVEALVDAGADRDIENLLGHKALDYAVKNYRLSDTEAVRKLHSLT